MTDKIPLQAIISSKTFDKYLLERENPCIIVSMKIWKVTQKLCNIQRISQLLRWCDFPPNVADKRFTVWVKKGVTTYCTLTQKGTLKSFQTLRKEYNLEQQDFYRPFLTVDVIVLFIHFMNFMLLYFISYF